MLRLNPWMVKRLRFWGTAIKAVPRRGISETPELLVLNDEVRARMRHCLVNDIKGGAFAREWSSEQAGGSQDLAKLKEQAFASAMAQAEEKVIELVQQAHSV